MENRGEASELQQLVPSDVDGDNDDSTLNEEAMNEAKTTSPLRGNKDGIFKQISSSGNSSVTRSTNKMNVGQSSGSRVLYVNEKRANREINKPTARPRNVHKANNSTSRHHCFLSEVPDVRHMERALLGLLADFHSGKLRAFGSGCTMEQMTNIREQQEKLAKLHFDLASANDTSLSEEGLKKSQNTMSQLIQRLEQLSMSIEGLQSNNK